MEYRGHLVDGYGYPWIDGRRVLLHRWIVEQVEGPLLPGEVVRHTCDNPPCFLYDHLARGTRSDNVLDSVERGRHAEASKLWCPKGHAYDSINAKGERRCKRCAATSSRKYRSGR